MQVSNVGNRLRLCVRLFAVVGLAVVLSLCSCGVNHAELERQSKTIFQNMLNDDPNFSTFGMRVESLTLVKEGSGNTYNGIARVKYRDRTHNVSTKVTYDGKNIMVSTEPGAFLFLMQ